MAFCRRYAVRTAFSLILAMGTFCQAQAAEQEKPSTDPKGDAVKQAKELAKPKEPQKPKPSDKPIEVIVTATRSEEKSYEVPYSTQVYSNQEVVERLSAVTNFVDAFKETPGVVVQKTAQGQGSPFIRGFTGYRNVIMIDGVRYNKSFFREGPNQYWAQIDPLSAQRIELVKGPSAVLYGSDSVGGTVNVLTKGTDTWSEKNEVGGSVYQWGSEAQGASVSRVEVKGSHKDKLGFFFGGSYKYYDDFRAGDETGSVENSGYYEFGGDAKIQYRPFKHHELTVAAQYWNQDSVPRTEQTRYAKPFHGTQIGTDFRNNNDEERALTYVKYRIDEIHGLIESAEITLSYQNSKELLHRVRSNSGTNPTSGDRRTEKNGFDVDTFGAQAQFISKTPIGTMTYGFDWYKDVVDSKRTENVFRLTNGGLSKTFRSTRPHAQGVVADDASYDLAGIYIQDEKSVLDGYLTLTAGGRFQYAQIDAGTIENLASPAVGFTSNSFSYYDNWKSLTGSFRFLVRPDFKKGDHWHVFGGVSQAFRAPSLYDATVVDSAGTFFESPSTSLKPEHFITYEIGTKARYDHLVFQASYFYTWIDDMILRNPTGQRIGNATVIEKGNGGQGNVKGIEAEVSYNFLKDFNVWGNVTWTEGALSQFEGDRNGNPPQFRLDKPFGKLIPVVGHMGFRYQPVGRNFWVELHADVADTADRLAVGDRFDFRRIPPGGTPGYGVFGIRGAAKFLNNKLTLTGGIDNIGNEDYRIHGSGENMPGTNAYLGVRFDW
ncbi:MAG: TonB-dependent receptor [Planctomycetes bacterium]|nr:TonB-dependent receptor [Planctomycetota bacterium]